MPVTHPSPLSRLAAVALTALGLAAPLGIAPASAWAQARVTELTVRVHVDGAVRRPGVYALRPGSRVAEAIAAAGGPTAGARLLTLNLARPVADGDRCHVPTPAEAAPAAPAATRAARRAAARPGRRAAPTPSAARGPIDLNHATPAELDTLPGVGPAMAARIIAARKKLGGFRRIEDLREVPGIGAKRLAKLRPWVELR